MLVWYPHVRLRLCIRPRGRPGLRRHRWSGCRPGGLMFARPGHSATYKAHIASAEWRHIRLAAIERAAGRCQLCGRSRDRLGPLNRHLEVHHNNYRNLGHEQPEDLIVLCAGGRGSCHTVADQQRRQYSRARRDKQRRRGRKRGRGPFRGLRLPILLIVFAGTMKAAAIVLPAVS